MLGKIRAFVNDISELPGGVSATATPRHQGDYLITLTQGHRELRLGHSYMGWRLAEIHPDDSVVLGVKRNLRDFLPSIEAWAVQQHT